MKYRIAILLFICILPALLWGFFYPVFGQETPEPSNKLDPALQEALATAITTPTDNVALPVIVYFVGKTDLSPTSLPTDELARRTAVVQRLQTTAQNSQANFLNELANDPTAYAVNGRSPTYRQLWIINALALTADPDMIQRLAQRSDVSHIALDSTDFAFEPAPNPDQFNFDFATPHQILTATQTEESLVWGVDRINAPAVWHGLGITGQGVTVAFMDSGQDWHHPVLFANYRGNLGNGAYDHVHNWYYAPNPPASLEPADSFGHGTHVAGTAVGQNGIGVAPGAKWMGVAIASANGAIYASAIHAGFQWLLAPGGDASFAPDVVNNSWGGDGRYNGFVADLQALHTADIITIFSAGNSGPFPQTIGSPASYTGTIAIAASDDSDAVAWFSSRGPSFLTDEQKPTFAAPGTHILSAWPGNHYAYLSGTSMAAPHATGAMALLLSANPALNQMEATHIFSTTAVPISDTIPNRESGWGRLDVYAAVQGQVPSGTLSVHLTSGGLPLPQTVITITTPDATPLPFVTNANGDLQVHVAPGTYQLLIAPFGYVPKSYANVVVPLHQTTTYWVDLTPLPSGQIQGTLNVPTATLHVMGTPVTVVAINGQYVLDLPAGTYDVVARALGYRLGRVSLTVTAGQTAVHNFTLLPSPKVLLVDSDQWSYSTLVHFYQSSLDQLDYAYDFWSIRQPFHDVPKLDDLTPYDTVIWAAAYGSPGQLGAGTTITNYLGQGGDLFISGQDVGRLDGYGFGTQRWWTRKLTADYLGEEAVLPTAQGVYGTMFSGLDITLNGGSSANNQAFVDQSRPKPNSLTLPTFTYDNGHIAGLQAGWCKPYHIVYLGFGLEGIADELDRTAVLNRAFATFAAPPIAAGVRWLSPDVNDFAIPGQELVYTFTVQNLSETLTDTFHLSLSGGIWPTSLTTTTLTLPPCSQGQTVITLHVPDGLPKDTAHTLQVTAVSPQTGATDSLTLHHKIPGTVLIVDDHRWYEFNDAYRAAVASVTDSYDLWEIEGPDVERGSPSLAFLRQYPFVVWYTGYDWYAPITAVERDTLRQYVSGGGRLFLTSQDYLYYNGTVSFTKNYLGIQEFYESITPTQIYAGDNLYLASSLAGPLPLTYDPYLNNSDGLLPRSTSFPFVWSNEGLPAGVATPGLTWRTVFFGFPFELLSEAHQPNMMAGVLGWLGDLGDSTFVADQPTIANGSPNTYTLRLQNLPYALTNVVTITNVLPPELTLLPETLSGGATYDANSRTISWQGSLPPGGLQVIAYQAVASLPTENPITNRVLISYARHRFTFAREATVWLEAPDLRPSRLTAVSRPPWLTYTLRLENVGLTAADMVTAVIRLPDPLTPVTPLITLDSGTGFATDNRYHWQGSLAPGAVSTITLAFTHTVKTKTVTVWAEAIIEDHQTAPLIRSFKLLLEPYRAYLPLGMVKP